MCSAQEQLWQHFQKCYLFAMTVFYPETSHIKLLALISARRKASCASTLVEVILGYQSKKHLSIAPNFNSSLWQLWLWLPCSGPTVSVGLSLAAEALSFSLSHTMSLCVTFSVSLCLFFFFLSFSLSLCFLQMANWPKHNLLSRYMSFYIMVTVYITLQ